MFEKVPLTELIVIAVVLKIILNGVGLSDALALGLVLIALNYKSFLPDKKRLDQEEIQKRLEDLERDTTVLKMRQLR